MENNINVNLQTLEVVHTKKYIGKFKCYGVIPRGRKQGKKCDKVLIEANDEGEIRGKIKCSRCKRTYIFK